MMKRLLLCMLLCLMACVGVQAKQKAKQSPKKNAKTENVKAGAAKPKPVKVYMFGFATSFVDSVAYMTDLQPVDANIHSNGFLDARSLYTLQLNNYLVANLKRENMTCAVFFNKDKAKAEKKYQKLRKRYRENQAVLLQPLGIDVFKFEAEPYVEPIIEEEAPAGNSKQEDKNKTKKDKRKKTPKKK